MNQTEGGPRFVRESVSTTAGYPPPTSFGAHVKKNGLNAADLKKKNLTIYLLVPSGKLTFALPWMNMLIGVFGLAIGRPGAARSVTLLVDEAPTLGYSPDLIALMSQYREAGLRVWLFTQTRAHMAAEQLYGETGFRAIFSNCTIKQFFALKEQEVLQLVSDMAGQRTADNTTKNERGESVGEVGVLLIRPEKVRGLKQWEQIIIMDKMSNPIKSRLVPYFKRRAWREMTDKNPYREG
nr:TraM recognition domain-containing protein [uncultured Sulfitobacter sp.]